MPYKMLMSQQTLEKIATYQDEILQGTKQAGTRLLQQLEQKNTGALLLEDFAAAIIATKRPQCYAEQIADYQTAGWNADELSILGDIGCAVPVTIYDNGLHRQTLAGVHKEPFTGTLLFVPGALLVNNQNGFPDYAEVVSDESKQINEQKYIALYERRLLPMFMEANNDAAMKGKQAFITIPGIGCGVFGGKFKKTLPSLLQAALINILETYGTQLQHIKAIYYDPFNQCENNDTTVHGISLLTRPFEKDNSKPQLCPPGEYSEAYQDCEFYSVVAWDHMSWPGNDFYTGNRMTDDGVKAAATDVCRQMTGRKGQYNVEQQKYLPDAPHRTWNALIAREKITLDARGKMFVCGAEQNLQPLTTTAQNLVDNIESMIRNSTLTGGQTIQIGNENKKVPRTFAEIFTTIKHAKFDTNGNPIECDWQATQVSIFTLAKRSAENRTYWRSDETQTAIVKIVNTCDTQTKSIKENLLALKQTILDPGTKDQGYKVGFFSKTVDISEEESLEVSWKEKDMLDLIDQAEKGLLPWSSAKEQVNKFIDESKSNLNYLKQIQII